MTLPTLQIAGDLAPPPRPVAAAAVADERGDRAAPGASYAVSVSRRRAVSCASASPAAGM
jgi:hypothetical protein